jgi:hypothetical protein
MSSSKLAGSLIVVALLGAFSAPERRLAAQDASAAPAAAGEGRPSVESTSLAFALPAFELAAAAPGASSRLAPAEAALGGALLGDVAAPELLGTVRAGIGFTADPTTFLMGLKGGFYAMPRFAIGAQLQIGVSDDDVIVAPTFNVEYLFDLPAEELDRLKPFVEGGLGFAYIHEDRRDHRDDEAGFLINFGFGLDYYVTDTIALGTSMLFNFLPDEVHDEHFFFSWQVIGARFDF